MNLLACSMLLCRMARALASIIAATLVLSASDARATGLHVAYAPGYALGHDSGFRHQLDAGVVATSPVSRVGSSIGMWGRGKDRLYGAAIQTGFGFSPTFLHGEFGSGEDTTIAGVAVLLGPSVRLHDRLGGGLSGRIAADVMALQVGLRLGGIVIGPREFNFSLTLGIGRF